MKDRFIARPAPWWEVVRVSPEGKRVVVATAASEQEARAEANRRTELAKDSGTDEANDDFPRETP